MQMNSRKPGAALTAGLLLGSISLIGGCANAGTQSSSSPAVDSGPKMSPSPTASTIDVSILGAAGEGDYAYFDSPASLAKRSAVVLVGTIDGFEDGQTNIYPPDEREHFAVARIKIDELFKAEGLTLADGFAYVSLPRGIEVVDAHGVAVPGSGVNFTVSAVRDFSNALPKGTQVAVMSSPLEPPRDAATRVIDSEQGHPAGSPLLSGRHPQLFSVVDEDGTLTGWAGLTYTSLLKALRSG